MHVGLGANGLRRAVPLLAVLSLMCLSSCQRSSASTAEKPSAEEAADSRSPDSASRGTYAPAAPELAAQSALTSEERIASLLGTTPNELPAYRVPRRIPSDGSEDVTAELLRYIRTVPNGSRIVFAKDGLYRINETLLIRDRRRLVFVGRGATFRAYTRGYRERSQFSFVKGSDVVIRDLTVKGANPNAGTSDDAYVPNLSGQHAFRFAGVQGAVLDDVQAYDLYGDFVYFGGWLTQQGRIIPSRNVTVQRSRFERNGRQGIAPIACEDVLIADNEIADVRRSTIDLEPNSDERGCERVSIIGNTFGASRLAWIASGGLGSKISDVYVADNVMREGSGFRLVLVTTNQNVSGMKGPFMFENNSLVVTAAGAFEFHRVHDITIRNNEVSGFSADMAAVTLFDSHTVGVYDNTFTGAAQILVADSASTEYEERGNTS